MQSFVRYFRVYTTGQAASGLGLEAQERDVQLYLDNYLDDNTKSLLPSQRWTVAVRKAVLNLPKLLRSASETRLL